MSQIALIREMIADSSPDLRHAVEGLPDITYAQAGQQIHTPVMERPQRV